MNNISSRVKANTHFLFLFQETTPEQQKCLIKTATDSQLIALFEVIKNVLFGNLPLSASKTKHLKRYAKHFFQIIDKKISIKKKKKIIVKYIKQFGLIVSTLKNGKRNEIS